MRAAFDALPEDARPGLMALRTLILDTAAGLPEVGRVEEALRWGQPSYLTPDTKTGTTLRLGVPKGGGFALYAHCQTTVIAEAREVAGDRLRYEGNRAILFEAGEALPEDLLRIIIGRALTYHRPALKRSG
ncbi:MAG: DUF1801 domain-containing protein [Pseudomonadota bacterium]